MPNFTLMISSNEIYVTVLAFIALMVVLYVIRHFCKGRARAIAMKYFVVAEKMVFEDADVKMKFIAQASYVALPKSIRSFVPPALFAVIITDIYDEIKNLLK